MSTPSEREDECYFCESGENLEVHHIVPQRLGGSDARHNLVTLCHDCHWKLERLYNKDFYKSLGVTDPRTTKEMHVTCDYHGCTNQAIEKIGRREVSTGEGASYYRCEEHLSIDEFSEVSDAILSYLKENPDTGYSAFEMQKKLGRDIMDIHFRGLQEKGMVKKAGIHWYLNPKVLEE